MSEEKALRAALIRALYDHRNTLLDLWENAGGVVLGPAGKRKLRAVEQRINAAERAEAEASRRPAGVFARAGKDTK